MDNETTTEEVQEEKTTLKHAQQNTALHDDLKQNNALNDDLQPEFALETLEFGIHEGMGSKLHAIFLLHARSAYSPSVSQRYVWSREAYHRLCTLGIHNSDYGGKTF